MFYAISRIQTLKKVFTAETTVQEKLIDRLLQLKVHNENLIGELALTLRVPRLYHKFIDQFGVQEFVRECLAYKERWETEQRSKLEQRKRMQERSANSVKKFVGNLVRS